MGKCLEGYFAVSLFNALIGKFLTKVSNINAIFHSDKYGNRFVSEMILLFP